MHLAITLYLTIVSVGLALFTLAALALPVVLLTAGWLQRLRRSDATRH